MKSRITTRSALRLTTFGFSSVAEGRMRLARARKAPRNSNPSPRKHQAWQLQWSDLDHDGRDEIIYASYRGIVTCQEVQSGKVLWTFDVEGLPYAIKSCDLDGDGKEEVLVSSSSLSTFALNAGGRLLWKHTSSAPPYALAAGRLLDSKQTLVAVGGEDVKATLLDKDGKVVKTLDYLDPNGYRTRIVAMDAGDTDGDGLDELLLVNHNSQFTLVDPRNGKFIWDQKESSGRWGYLFDGRLLDLDGDGRCEAYAGGKTSVIAVSPDGRRLWQKPGGVPSGVRQANLSSVDFDGDGKRELAVQFGPEVSVFDAAGSVRYNGNTRDLCFNGIASSPDPKSRQVMIASVTGADRNVYRLTFGSGDRNELDSFENPPGYRADINHTLETMREQVLKLPVDKATPKRPVWILVSGGQPKKENLIGGGRRRVKLHEVYPYPHIDYYTAIGYQEPGYETTQAATHSVAELMELAEVCESSKLAHMFIVAHGHNPAVSPATLDGWLQRTPTSCIGIFFSELNVSFFNLPENAKYKPVFDKFMDESMVPLIDIAAKHRKPSHMLMKENWWAFAPAMQSMVKRLFTPERRRWIVPSVEESAAVSPETNVMGWMGLWRSGLVEQWATNVINDQIVLNSHMTEWEPTDPHHVLRHLVAYAAAGSTSFLPQPQQINDRHRRYDLPGDQLNYTPFGLISQDLFIHLIGKGILDIPTRDTIYGLSPVAFRFDEPSMDFLKCDNNSVSHVPPVVPEVSAKGLFSGTEWAFLKTRDHYAPRYLLGIERHGHDYIPRTPFGLPTIVPGWFNSPHCDYMQSQIHTDGIDVIVDGKPRSAAEMKPTILKSFADAAARLPIRATNCFWIGTRRADGTIRLTLVDSPYVDPVGVEAELDRERADSIAARCHRRSTCPIHRRQGEARDSRRRLPHRGCEIVSAMRCTSMYQHHSRSHTAFLVVLSSAVFVLAPAQMPSSSSGLAAWPKSHSMTFWTQGSTPYTGPVQDVFIRRHAMRCAEGLPARGSLHEPLDAARRVGARPACPGQADVFRPRKAALRPDLRGHRRQRHGRSRGWLRCATEADRLPPSGSGALDPRRSEAHHRGWFLARVLRQHDDEGHRLFQTGGCRQTTQRCGECRQHGGGNQGLP